MKKIFRRNFFRSFLVISICTGIIIGVLFFIISFFRITHVEVEPSTISVKIDEEQLPANLLFFPSDKAREYLLKEYPGFKDIQFIKQFPHTLKIHIVLREPVAKIENRGN